ncbi:uncharacterized protein I303_105515 [Kwoniella dejecticola CBS 10117]|uniref:Uncharacterized protein n=1 Tax=Kwoniella dejecticola CBS 10117 TaxID=1296121 RepID=A0AAJ8MJ35_9TREE
MSNLQDITHLHAFHLGSTGRRDSAPAVLTQNVDVNKQKTPSHKSQNGYSRPRQGVDARPVLPKFLINITSGPLSWGYK